MYIQSISLPKNQEIKLTGNDLKHIVVSRDTDSQPEVVQRIRVDGEREVYADLLRDRVKHRKLLKEVVDSSNTVLFHAKAIWPFDFFPNEIIIDVARVTILKREFFWTGNIESLYIKDLMHITVETGPFFSTLRLVDTSFDKKKHFIAYLKRNDAFRAREILQGLVIASKSGVDLTKCDIGFLAPSISELSDMPLACAI